MKRRIVSILLALALLAGASAEALSVWANRADGYYHWDKTCGHPASERFALSEEAASEFGLAPCPDCKPQVVVETFPLDDAPTAQPTTVSQITCAERGGTWVFRVPAAMLNEIELKPGQTPESADALVSVFGENLTDALDATLAVPEGDELVMCLRIIGSDAYMVVRPEKSYKEKRPLQWVAEKVAADIFNSGAYSVTGVSGTMSYIPPKDMPDLGRTASEDYGDCDVDIYTGEGLYIAVIHMDHIPDGLTGTLRIGFSNIPVTGYVSKKKAVFCCALSAVEMNSLLSAAPTFIPAAEDDGSDFRPITTLPPDLFANDGGL